MGMEVEAYKDEEPGVLKIAVKDGRVTVECCQWHGSVTTLDCRVTVLKNKPA